MFPEEWKKTCLAIWESRYPAVMAASTPPPPRFDFGLRWSFSNFLLFSFVE